MQDNSQQSVAEIITTNPNNKVDQTLETIIFWDCDETIYPNIGLDEYKLRSFYLKNLGIKTKIDPKSLELQEPKELSNYLHNKFNVKYNLVLSLRYFGMSKKGWPEFDNLWSNIKDNLFKGKVPPTSWDGLFGGKTPAWKGIHIQHKSYSVNKVMEQLKKEQPNKKFNIIVIDNDKDHLNEIKAHVKSGNISSLTLIEPSLSHVKHNGKKFCFIDKQCYQTHKNAIADGNKNNIKYIEGLNQLVGSGGHNWHKIAQKQIDAFCVNQKNPQRQDLNATNIFTPAKPVINKINNLPKLKLPPKHHPLGYVGRLLKSNNRSPLRPLKIANNKLPRSK